MLYSTKKYLVIISVGFMSLTASPSSNASFFAAATEPSQIAHTATNSGGWLWDAQAWLQDRGTDLEKLMELVENNILTSAIRGFNELMTAIQGDISDVLGTIDTLAGAPLDIFEDLMEIPGSIIGMVGPDNPFSDLFNDVTDIFDTIGEYQALGNTDFEDIFGSGKSFKSPFELSNRISGTRSKLGSDFLDESEARDRMYKRWQKNSYGRDSIQMQSTQIDIMKEVVKNQNRDQEFIMMDRLQDNSDRIMIYEREKSRSNRVYSDAHQDLINQLW